MGVSASIQQLARLERPRRRGIEPSDPTWHEVERLVGSTVPAELKEVIHLYGDQMLRDQVHVLSGRAHPTGCASDLVDYLVMFQSMRDDPVFADEPWLRGVAGRHWLPWATDLADDHVMLVWDDDGANGWVGIAGVRGEDWQVSLLGVVAWLVAWLRGDIEVDLATMPDTAKGVSEGARFSVAGRGGEWTLHLATTRFDDVGLFRVLPPDTTPGEGLWVSLWLSEVARHPAIRPAGTEPAPRPLPRLRAQIGSTPAGAPLWRIEDLDTGEAETTGELTPEVAALSPATVWDVSLLLERLAEGWRPTDWRGHRTSTRQLPPSVDPAQDRPPEPTPTGARHLLYFTRKKDASMVASSLEDRYRSHLRKVIADEPWELAVISSSHRRHDEDELRNIAYDHQGSYRWNETEPPYAEQGPAH